MRDDIDWQREQASKIEGIEWNPRSRTKGLLNIAEGVRIEFDFKGFPSFKIFPKETRDKLPRPEELVPSLVLWEDDDHPSWAEVLVELKTKIESAMTTRDGSWYPSIEEKLLLGLIDAARRSHPNECFFLIKRGATGVLSEVVLPQGAKGGRVSAIFSPDRLPYDRAIEASFHSHPSGNGMPSAQDLIVFVKYKFNIIAFYPYGDSNYKVFNNRGKEIELSVRD